MINKLFGPLLAKLPENNKMERIWILAKTDFRKRYYGTNLGILWALLNPLYRLVLYYTIFVVFFNVEIENFALYIFSGLLIWMFFSESTKKGLNLFRSKRYLLENIKLNKFDLYKSALLSTSFALIFNFIVYFVFSLFFTIEYSLNILFFPLIIMNLCIFVYAIMLIVSLINVYLRDFHHVWDMILLLLFWTSPIFYGRSVILEEYPVVAYLNPLSGLITNVREVLIYSEKPDLEIFFINFISSIILLIVSILGFRKLSDHAVEIL